MKRRCRKSYQAMFSGLRLPFVARRETLEWSTGCSTNQCNIRENAQTNVSYRLEHIFLLLPSQTQENTNTLLLLLLLWLYQVHCDFLPRMWKIIYRWCGKWKGWTEKCVARFVRWEICHWTLLWKRISLWYYCSVLDKNHGISCVSMGWEEEMSSIQSTKFERWSNVKSKALHHFLDIVRCGTSYSVAFPRDMVMVYKSLIYRYLPFERPGSLFVDHSSHEVQTQLDM